MVSRLKGIFITGTDTGVGKSRVGAQLVSTLYQSGVSVSVRKPVESGCDRINGLLIPNDAQRYFDAVQGAIDLAMICPFKYEPALAPPTAARQTGARLWLKELVAACSVEGRNMLVIEGAGGFYSPIAEDGLNADLATALGLPVLLVAANRLGCINHVLLTLEAIKKHQLETLAIVLNETEPGTALKENVTSLASIQATPVITLGYQQKLDIAELLLVSGHPLESLNHRVR